MKSSIENTGAKRFKHQSLNRLASFISLGLLILPVSPGCGFFKGGSSDSSSGVTAPGAAGHGYAHHIFTSPSTCAQQGSIAIYRKSSHHYGPASERNPFNDSNPFAVNLYDAQRTSWQTPYGHSRICNPSMRDDVFIKGYIKNNINLCPKSSGIVYFRCEGKAFTDTGFCCLSGHVSCSSAVQTHKTTNHTGDWGFYPISGGQVTLIPSIQPSKTKVNVSINFNFGQSSSAGFYCVPP